MAIPFAFAISTSQQASQSDREEAGFKLPELLGSCFRLQLKVCSYWFNESSYALDMHLRFCNRRRILIAPGKPVVSLFYFVGYKSISNFKLLYKSVQIGTKFVLPDDFLYLIGFATGVQLWQ